MPNIKSAKKRVLVNKTKTARNKSRNSALKTAIRRLTPLLRPMRQIRRKLLTQL